MWCFFGEAAYRSSGVLPQTTLKFYRGSEHIPVGNSYA